MKCPTGPGTGAFWEKERTATLIRRVSKLRFFFRKRRVSEPQAARSEGGFGVFWQDSPRMRWGKGAAGFSFRTPAELCGGCVFDEMPAALLDPIL